MHTINLIILSYKFQARWIRPSLSSLILEEEQWFKFWNSIVTMPISYILTHKSCVFVKLKPENRSTNTAESITWFLVNFLVNTHLSFKSLIKCYFLRNVLSTPNTNGAPKQVCIAILSYHPVLFLCGTIAICKNKLFV